MIVVVYPYSFEYGLNFINGVVIFEKNFLLYITERYVCIALTLKEFFSWGYICISITLTITTVNMNNLLK